MAGPRCQPRRPPENLIVLSHVSVLLSLRCGDRGTPIANITTDADGKFLYPAYETNIVDMEPFEQLDIPHWVVDLDEPVGDFLTRNSMACGTRHLTAVPGHQSGALRKLAHLQGFRSVGA